jgi:hypothetical protein
MDAIETVAIRQSEVEDDGVVGYCPRRGQSLAAGRERVDAEAESRKAFRDRLGKAEVILDQQDAHAARLCGVEPSAQHGGRPAFQSASSPFIHPSWSDATLTPPSVPDKELNEKGIISPHHKHTRMAALVPPYGRIGRDDGVERFTLRQRRPRGA